MSPQPARQPSPPIILSLGCSAEECRLVQSVLAATGYEVKHADTCREALEYIRGGPVAVIICEADLPDGDWREILQVISAPSGGPPIIVTSRFADDRLWAEVLNLGGYDLLLKPLDCTEVLRVVSAAAQACLP